MISQDKIVETGISLADISFAYQTTPILQSLNLDIPKGEIWALVGRSGVGKTTLLQIVAGLFQPTTGEVRICGRQVPVVGRIKGIVFQDDCLLGWLTAEENILFPHHRKRSPERRALARGMMDAVGLKDLYFAKPFEFSTGMRKRLEFARALVADEEYILADEPFGTVDALTRRELWQLWLDLRAKNPRTGILSTHHPEEAVRLCDAVVTLRQEHPSILSQPIRIPKEIRKLNANEQNEQIGNLRQKILYSLEG